MEGKVIIRQWSALQVWGFLESRCQFKECTQSNISRCFIPYFLTFLGILELRMFCCSSTVWCQYSCEQGWCKFGVNQGTLGWDWSNCIDGMAQEALGFSKEGLWKHTSCYSDVGSFHPNDLTLKVWYPLLLGFYSGYIG